MKCLESCLSICLHVLGKPQKNGIELSGHKIFSMIFLELQKQSFFSGQALTPLPPLSGRATKKRPIFFCGFPKALYKMDHYFLDMLYSPHDVSRPLNTECWGPLKLLEATAALTCQLVN